MRRLNQTVLPGVDATVAQTSLLLYGRYLQKWTFTASLLGTVTGSGALQVQQNNSHIIETMQLPDSTKWVNVPGALLNISGNGVNVIGPLEIIAQAVQLTWVPTAPGAGTTLVVDVEAIGLT